MSLNSNPFCGLFTIDHTAKLLGLEDVAAFLHLTPLPPPPPSPFYFVCETSNLTKIQGMRSLAL